jgi:hypothetical protein
VSESIQIVTQEAKILSNYLIGQDCTDEMATHYEEAVYKLNAEINQTEWKTWERMLSSKIYLKLVDSGLAITNPQSHLRKRIFIMLAILEASPEFTRYFLPQRRTVFYIVPLGLRAMLSALYLVLGIATVKALKIH